MAIKTNALRILDQLGVRYQTRQYEVDPEDLTAETVASKIGFPAGQVFKTLVAIGDRTGVCLAVIPGDAHLDLKALARASGDRRVTTAPLKDVPSLTGYMRGAVTVFGCKKAYPVFIDETVYLWNVISVSAGQRGVQALLTPDDYIRASGGKVVALTE